MGRPINDRYLGNTQAAGGADLTGEGKISATVKVGANTISDTGILLSQRTETKFKVNDTANGTAVNVDGTQRDGSVGTGNVGFCVLVDKAEPGNDEMVVKGYINGTGDGVNIRKFHNRTVIDFNNNRYTWEIQDDSTANILVLTAI